MDESTSHSRVATATAPSMRSLCMAILAPFAVIALLASPLAFDALKHAAGL
jgi:hypothetical protein